MLFPDLSVPQSHEKSNTGSQRSAGWPLAFVSDRLLALVFDFLLLSPVVSLVTARLVRQKNTAMILDSQSGEGLLLAGLVFLVGAGVIILSQAVFWYHWQATPGQYFFQLRVASYIPEKSRLNFSQCLVRSICFVASFAMCALPFLEVLSHPFRRAFHERASDTIVITLKKVHDEGPHRLEEQFVGSWLRSIFFVFLFFISLGAIKAYKSFHSLAVSDLVDHSSQCKEVSDKIPIGEGRLDASLALFVLSEISADCLNKEADASLWEDPKSNQDLAYLAKFISATANSAANSRWREARELVLNKEDKTQYYQKVCRDPKSTACVIGKYLFEDGEASTLKSTDEKLLISQVLRMQDFYDNHKYVKSLEVIEKLQAHSFLRIPLEKQLVKTSWVLRESLQTQGGRAPASADANKWLDRFKEKYGIE